jgi:septal ring factor EnvC (AmiA/AmiB activator)
MRNLPKSYDALESLYRSTEEQLLSCQQELTNLRVELEQVQAVKTRASLLNNAAQDSMSLLVKEKNELVDMIKVMVAEKKQWIEEKDNQQTIMAKQLKRGDGAMNAIQNELISLKAKMKKAMQDSIIDDKTLDRALLVSQIKRFF